MNWKMEPATLGLTVLAISPGFASPESMTWDSTKVPTKALLETVVIALAGAHATKSWWPIAGPILYLVADYLWDKQGAVQTWDNATAALPEGRLY
jgi:hypothetical protein